MVAPSVASVKYSGPIEITHGNTIEAIATASGYTESDVAIATYTIVAETQVATPRITPGTGTYIAGIPVTIGDATPGATIYYTTNGKTPTTSSTKYKSSFFVDVPETVKAIAVAAGYTPSAVASATYTLKTAPPMFTPAAGGVAKGQKVKIADSTAHAVIYYTTNGTTPTTASTRYTAEIAVTASETIKAMAIAPGDEKSQVVTAAYKVEKPAATPVISPKSGAVAKGATVKITDATKGATIYYTTNNTAPTNKSTKYTSAIKVSSAETIKAIAVAPNDLESGVAKATYTIE